MFAKARTAARAHEIVVHRLGFELKGQRKAVFRRVVNAQYPHGMNDAAIAFSFMTLQISLLSDEYSPEKERWVNVMCDRLSGLIADARGFSEEVDPHDVLREQRNRFKPKRTTKRKTKPKPKPKPEPKAKRKVENSRSGEARAKGDVWDNYYDKLVELNGCSASMAQRIISKIQAGQELTDHERNFWYQVQSKKQEAKTKAERWESPWKGQRSASSRTVSGNAAPKRKAKAPKRATKKTGSLLDIYPNPTSDSGYVPRARGDVWDNYYDQLLELNGCGPKTAQTIISKVQSERELTEREYAFWDRVE